MASATRSSGSDGGGLAEGVLGFAFIVGVPFYLIVWRNVPLPYWVKWGILVGFAALAVAIYLVAKHQKWGRVLQLARTRGKRFGDLLIFVILAVGVTAAALWFAEEEQAVLFKVFIVLYFSLLPAVLYVQFVATRAKTAWDEYVLNLFQLHIDDYAHLPQPPRASRYYPVWRRARAGTEKADDDERSTPRRAKAPEADESIYQRKFEALFGKVEIGRTATFTSLRSENIFPVATATLLITVGWILVVDPEPVWEREFMPSGFALTGLPDIPHETFAFAFLGAYFYILQMFVRRYFQSDLKTSAYINATMRIIVAVLIVWTLDLLLRDDLSQAERSAMAFVVGVFPTAGWQALQQLVKRLLGVAVPSMRQDYPLSDLDGLNIWYESRLLEEGVEDMQNLATANIVDVMLNTRIPVERLVDWIDQSLLYLRVSGEKQKNGTSDRTKLRRFGIRTATDLQDTFAYADAEDKSRRAFRKGLEQLLNGADGEPSATRSMLATLETERNLQHVREWKSFRSDGTRLRKSRSAVPQNGNTRSASQRNGEPTTSRPPRERLADSGASATGPKPS